MTGSSVACVFSRKDARGTYVHATRADCLRHENAAMSSNLEVLLAWHNSNFAFCAVLGNYWTIALVALAIQSNAHEVEIRTHAGTKLEIVFADAPGEDQKIKSTQSGRKSSNRLLYRAREDLNCKLCTGIAEFRR